MRHLFALGATAVSFVGACSTRPALLSAACSNEAPVPTVGRDSAVVLCVPRDFVRMRTGNGWVRGTPGAPSRAWFSVQLLDSAAVAQEAEGRPWPPSFRRAPGFGVPDGYVVDSVVTHRDTVEGLGVSVETGLVTGGFAGEQRAPALLAVWSVAPGRWALVQARTTDRATLDTIRAVVRSVRPGASARPRAAAI